MHGEGWPSAGVGREVCPNGLLRQQQVKGGEHLATASSMASAGGLSRSIYRGRAAEGTWVLEALSKSSAA